MQGLSNKHLEIVSLQKWSVVNYDGRQEELSAMRILFAQVSQDSGRLQESLTHRLSSIPLKIDLKRHRMDHIN